jgi:hypothetical protein
MPLLDLNTSTLKSREELINIFESWDSSRIASYEIYEDNSHDDEIIQYLSEHYYNQDGINLVFNKDCLRNTTSCIIRSKGQIVGLSIIKLINSSIGQVIEGYILCSRFKGLHLGLISTKYLMIYGLKKYINCSTIFLSSSHTFDLPIHSTHDIFHLPVNDLLLLKSGYCKSLPSDRMKHSYEYIKPTEDDFNDMMKLYESMPYQVKYILDLKDMITDPYLEIVLCKKSNKLCAWVCYAKKNLIVNSYRLREHLYYVGGWVDPIDIFGGVDCDVITFNNKPPYLSMSYLMKGTGKNIHYLINANINRSTTNFVGIS